MTTILSYYQYMAGVIASDTASVTDDGNGPTTALDYPRLLHISSAHFLLPALYYACNNTHRQAQWPAELWEVARQIALINHNRNQSLIAQAQQIAQCFNKAGINYVFLKGMALLLGGYYKHEGERMVGDIDVLVAPHQVAQSHALLQTHLNYRVLEQDHKLSHHHHHLPRLIQPEALAAVEIHKAVAKKPSHSALQTQHLLREKQQIGTVYIPCATALIWHNAQHFFTNNSGYIGKLVPNFRSYQDVMAVLQQHPTLYKLFETHRDLQVFATHHSIYSTYFKSYRPHIAQLLNLRMRYRWFSIMWQEGFMLLTRLNLLLTSQAYRRKLWKMVRAVGS